MKKIALILLIVCALTCMFCIPINAAVNSRQEDDPTFSENFVPASNATNGIISMIPEFTTLSVWRVNNPNAKATSTFSWKFAIANDLTESQNKNVYYSVRLTTTTGSTIVASGSTTSYEVVSGTYSLPNQTATQLSLEVQGSDMHAYVVIADLTMRYNNNAVSGYYNPVVEEYITAIEAQINAGGNGDYVDGYRLGYQAGENAGYASGSASGYNTGYNVGYSAGLDEGTNLWGYVASIATIPFTIFSSFLNFEIFNVNLAGLVSALITAGMIAFLWKTFVS